MAQVTDVRWGWLKLMYIYTIIGAGASGLGILIVPEVMKSIFQIPEGDQITLSITGSVYLAFAVLSILGLREPLKYAPILLLQLGFKTIWFVGSIIPLAIAGDLPTHAILIGGIYATYIIGDLIAIPFKYLFRTAVTV